MLNKSNGSLVYKQISYTPFKMQEHTGVLASGPVVGVRLRNIWSPTPRHYMMSGKAAVNSGDERSYKILYRARVRLIG